MSRRQVCPFLSKVICAQGGKGVECWKQGQTCSRESILPSSLQWQRRLAFAMGRKKEEMGLYHLLFHPSVTES